MKNPPGVGTIALFFCGWMQQHREGHRLSEDGEEDWGEGAVGGGDDFGGVGVGALVEVFAVPGIEYL